MVIVLGKHNTHYTWKWNWVPFFFSSNGQYSPSAYLDANETSPLHQGSQKGEARGCRGLEQPQQLQKLLHAPTYGV